METVYDAKSLSEALRFLADKFKRAADDFAEFSLEPGECEDFAGLLSDLAEHASGLERLAGREAVAGLGAPLRDRGEQPC